MNILTRDTSEDAVKHVQIQHVLTAFELMVCSSGQRDNQEAMTQGKCNVSCQLTEGSPLPMHSGQPIATKE